MLTRIAFLLLLATAPALADPVPAAVPAPVVVAPVLTDAERAALVIAGIRAGLVEAQTGVQQTPALQPWADTKAGKVVMAVIAGAIIVTSAAGAAAGVIVALK